MGVGLLLGVVLLYVWVLVFSVIYTLDTFDLSFEEADTMLKIGSVIMFCMGFVTGLVTSDI